MVDLDGLKFAGAIWAVTGVGGYAGFHREDAKGAKVVFAFVLVSRVRERPGDWCGRKVKTSPRRRQGRQGNSMPHIDQEHVGLTNL